FPLSARTESDGAKSNDFCPLLPVQAKELTVCSQKPRRNVLLISPTAPLLADSCIAGWNRRIAIPILATLTKNKEIPRMSQAICNLIAQELNVRPEQVIAAVTLIDDGNTV